MTEPVKICSIPRTYSEWVIVLEILKSGGNDSEILEVLTLGELEWQSGIAERFIKRLADVINSRMNAAADKFQRDIGSAAGRESLMVNALLSLRKEMRFLAQAAELPAIPEENREQFRRLILEQADNMQKSLEDSAKSDRSGKLSSVVRNNRVNTF